MIVTDNLFGDVLTDLAVVVTGGIGLAASGNINLSGALPSLFEPVHGSAPDIAGQGKADPTTAAVITMRYIVAGPVICVTEKAGQMLANSCDTNNCTYVSGGFNSPEPVTHCQGLAQLSDS